MLKLFFPAISALGEGYTEDSLWQGMEFLDARWLLWVVTAINPEH